MIFEKIRKELNKRCEYTNLDECVAVCCGECAIGNTLDILDDLEAEYNNGWIPCSERLPEEGQCVLVQTKKYWDCGDETLIEIRMFDPQYNGHDWKQIGCGRWIANRFVIAWQPLPEPYIPKKGE